MYLSAEKDCRPGPQCTAVNGFEVLPQIIHPLCVPCVEHLCQFALAV